MTLSQSQKREMHESGYVAVRGAVARAQAREALRAINASLGQNGMHPDELPRLRSQTYCREITNNPVITDLFNNSPLFPLCESLLGEGNVPRVGGGQIALRFPVLDEAARPPRPHLDGVAAPHNGVPPGTYHNFTCLIGVFLSEVPEPDMGNFTVWPGTHQRYEQYFKEHGVERFLEGAPPIDLPEPLQFTGRAGDAVICHHLLGHGIAPNVSPFVRYAVFFRIEHPQHDAHRKDVLADLWHDWPGMRETIKTA